MTGARGAWMEAEIREQPGLLAGLAEPYFTRACGSLEGVRPELVLLVARGSSDHAALYARYLIEVHLGIPAMLAAPSVWTKFGKRPRYPHCLAIGISQSGAAPDVAEVLQAMRADGHATLAITNNGESRITKAADQALLLDVGVERSIAATKTFTASLLALYQVVRALGAPLPAPETPDEAWLATCERSALDQMGPVVRCSPLFALARGFDFATAHETALKLMECALLPCKAYSTSDFEHGPKALAGPQTAAIVYGTAAPNLAAQGCSIVTPPDCPVVAELRPLWDVLFGQWIALHAARARGLDPDHAPNLQKVTETR